MANSITARFNDNCKVHVAMSDDTTVTKAVIIDADGTETDIGGGGTSDFSTAKVTVVNNVDSEWSPNNTPFLSSDELIGEHIGFSVYVESAGTYEFTVPLYKGKCVWGISEDHGKSFSGNITYIEDYNMSLITGDCTITIS